MTTYISLKQSNTIIILGIAKFALQEYNRENEIEEYARKATSGNYLNLLNVTNEYLGDIIEFVE